MTELPAMRSWYSDDLGVSIELPETWDVASSDEFPLLLLAPDEQGFRANVGLAIGTLDPPTPEALETVIDDARAERRRDLTDFELVGERRQIQDGYPGYLMRSNWTLDEASVGLAQISALFLTGPDGLYQVHCTALAELADAYLPIFRHVLSSIRFTNAA